MAWGLQIGKLFESLLENPKISSFPPPPCRLLGLIFSGMGKKHLDVWELGPVKYLPCTDTGSLQTWVWYCGGRGGMNSRVQLAVGAMLIVFAPLYNYYANANANANAGGHDSSKHTVFFAYPALF